MSILCPVIALLLSAAVRGEESPPTTGPTIHVTAFRFTGNTAILSTDLDPLVAPFLGRDCDLTDLRHAADLVTEEYLRRGYSLAKAFVPAQDAKGGVVEITVVEGRLGQVVVEGNDRYSEAFIRRAFRNLEQGDPVTNAALERDLLLLNENPDLRVRGFLEPGSAPGTVDVHARVEESFPLHVGLDVNNFGTEATSRVRFGTRIDWSNAVLSGGHLSIRGVVGEDPEEFAFARGGYALPVGGSGMRVGVWGSWGDFDVSGDLRDLEIRGTTAQGGAYASYPWIKRRQAALVTEIGIDVKDSEYFLLGDHVSDDEIRLVRVGARFDNVCWQGHDWIDLFVYEGLGEFMGGLSEDDPRASRREADNSFTRVNLDVARVQRISDTFSVFVRGSGQVASESLVAGEQMTIGGADSVRGYPQSEFEGDEGANASLELRVAPLHDKGLAQLVGFLDWGMVHIEEPGGDLASDRHLMGAGVGVRISPPWKDAGIRFDVGWPLEGDPSTGGTPEYYLSGSIRF